MYDLKQSNGIVAEVNSHDIDTLRGFAGSEIVEVYAIGGNFRCPQAREKYPDFYDNVSMVCRFANGRQGMIDGEIYRSDDAGATWQKVSPDKRSIGGNPGYYYGQIVVDPIVNGAVGDTQP